MSSEKRDASPEASPLKGPAPKAVPEDTSDVVFEDGIPLSPMAADQQVQFISGTPANGDAKVEIGDSSSAPTFVGLGKEELMKYANDPFWVKLRWFLFILFWVLWIAMLVGAVVIIVLAPRCAEKKTVAETYYQIKASDLVKDGQGLKDLEVQHIVITEALQHQPGEPEAVTNFDAFDSGINEGLLTSAINGLKEKGIKILLQIVPNHSGTQHEWFNETDKYVRKPSDTVNKSVWRQRGGNLNAWTADNRPGFDGTSYLQQFPGQLADLNFRNDDVVNAFKQTLNSWRGKDIDGFLISKASFLLENLDQLLVINATINQPENARILQRIAGTSTKGPVVVELEDASGGTIQQFVDKGMIPLLKSIDADSAEKVKQALEALNQNPTAVVDLSKQSTTPEKLRLLKFLVSVGGSHSVHNHETSNSDPDFTKKLLQFQKANPRGKLAKFSYAVEGSVLGCLRSDGDDYLIIANLNTVDSTFDAASAFNLTQPVTGSVVFQTPNAKQKDGESYDDKATLNPLSGVVIKLAKHEESS